MVKAQLKIQQMAFMLLAVTLLFVLVGMFVLMVKFSSLKDSATALREENSMLLVSKLANSPEFSCGEAFDTNEINCIDADKVMILKENIAKYSGFWGGVSNIEIRKISPKSIECTQKNYPDCEIIRLRLGITGTYVGNFVSLCRKDALENEIYNKCELAQLMVSYEEIR
ncbi:MAG: hypothetical protein ABIB79_05225 [archaeon]